MAVVSKIFVTTTTITIAEIARTKLATAAIFERIGMRHLWCGKGKESDRRQDCCSGVAIRETDSSAYHQRNFDSHLSNEHDFEITGANAS